ncbi:major capsid protein P2 [Psychrobium sp. 1_MG-2023]|uniref:major capsid protein P2 n=1 Tax=Psychrobium sp. 1_MG-2023 TaxID=3062624 RepID=UPI000C3268E8|nr:major capsid protein P2 [Psychrobium sp. 1_MG-2023]MDP2562675.1 major capsid protein P2 [Psychrobium sp. 1_MG-2023]PKF54811.1 hypothetical protein CW748_15425 [Alteromonadales bacterium alter-6D02]
MNQVTRALRKIQPAMIQLASPTGSGYEEEWSIKLQAGMTYHGIELETDLEIKKVTLDIGGTPVCYSSNVMMDLFYKRDNHTFNQIIRPTFKLLLFDRTNRSSMDAI